MLPVDANAGGVHGGQRLGEALRPGFVASQRTENQRLGRFADHLLDIAHQTGVRADFKEDLGAEFVAGASPPRNAPAAEGSATSTCRPAVAVQFAGDDRRDERNLGYLGGQPGDGLVEDLAAALNGLRVKSIRERQHAGEAALLGHLIRRRL